MAIKTIKLRRAADATKPLAGLTNKTLAYGEPMYNEANKAVVIGDSTETSQCDALDRIDIIPSSRTRKEMFGEGTKAGSTITLNKVTDIDGATIPVGTVASVSAGTGLIITGTATTAPKVEIDSGYKLPTTTEWSDRLNILSGSSGIKVNSNAVYLKNNLSDDVNVTISASDPSGGNEGDIWFKYE